MAHQHGGYFSIDLYAFNSKLKKINPEYKLISALITLILTIVFNNIFVSAYILFLMFFITVNLGGMDIFEYISMLLAPLGFIVLASISIAFGLSFEQAGEFYIKIFNIYIHTSRIQLIEAFELMIKVLACVSIMQSLILSTMPYEIINALRSMHVPKLIIELMNLIYRFIFILIENMAGNILLVTLKKANPYYTAMEARCFEGDLNFLQEEKKLKKKNLVITVLNILIMFAIWIFTLNYGF